MLASKTIYRCHSPHVHRNTSLLGIVVVMLLFTKVATAAGKIIQWQELKGDEVKLLKADASGNYVAVQYLNGEVQVWTLRGFVA